MGMFYFLLSSILLEGYFVNNFDGTIFFCLQVDAFIAFCKSSCN